MVEQLRSLGEIPSFRELIHNVFVFSNALVQMISAKARDHIQYSLKIAWANDGRELSLPKANGKLEKKEQQTNPCASGAGVSQEPISKEKLFPVDSSRARDFFPP